MVLDISNELSSEVIEDWSWLDFVVVSGLDSNDFGVVSEVSNELSSEVIRDRSWLDFLVFSGLDSNDIGVVLEVTNELSSDVMGDWSWLDHKVFSGLDSNDIGVVLEVSNELSSEVMGDWSWLSLAVFSGLDSNDICDESKNEILVSNKLESTVTFDGFKIGVPSGPWEVSDGYKLLAVGIVDKMIFVITDFKSDDNNALL